MGQLTRPTYAIDPVNISPYNPLIYIVSRGSEEGKEYAIEFEPIQRGEHTYLQIKEPK
jgi:hypothetical protein